MVTIFSFDHITGEKREYPEVAEIENFVNHKLLVCNIAYLEQIVYHQRGKL